MKKLLVVLFLILSAKHVEAAEIFISPTGNDMTGNGTIGNPYGTIQHGANLAVCGDIIQLLGGTYTENVGIGTYPSLSINTVNCTSFSNAVTLQGYPGSTPTIQTAVGEAVIGFQSGDYPAPTRDIYWIIKNVNLNGSIYPDIESSAIIGESIAHVRIQDVTIQHTQGSGVFLNTFTDTGNHTTDYDIDGWEFLNLNCHDTGEQHQADGRQHHCLYLAHTKNTLIEGGTFYHNYGYCGQIYGDHTIIRKTKCWDSNYANGGNGGWVVSADGDNKLYDNIVWDIPYGDAIQLGQPCVGCYALNNTIINSATGVAAEIGSLNSFVENNLAYGNSVDVVDRGSNTTVANNQTTNPSFASTDPASSSYLKLQATSSAIASGLNLSSIFTDDYSGATRPSSPTAWSIGAYEGNGGPPVPSLVSITPTSGFISTAPTITLTGDLTVFDVTSTVLIGGLGVTAGTYNVLDNTHMTAVFTVAADAADGSRDVTIRTTGSPDITKPNAFTVQSGAATINTITPNQGVQGQTLSVVVVASNSHFINNTTTLNAMSGVTINNVTANSATQATLSLTISGGALVGFRDITLVTNSETTVGGLNGFTITQASSCAPVNVSDASGPVNGQCVSRPLDDGTGTSTTITPNLPSAVSTQSGHYEIVTAVIGCKDTNCAVTTSVPVTSITSALGNTFTKVMNSATNLTSQIEVWIAPVTHAGTEHVTVNYGGTTTYYGTALLEEFYGLATSSPFDVSGTNTGSSTTPSISTSSPTTATNEIVYAFVTSGSAVVAEHSPYTLIQALSDNADEYMLASATGTKTATFTTSNADWIGVIATFKPNTPFPLITTITPNTSATRVTNLSIAIVTTNAHMVDMVTTGSFNNVGGMTVNSTTVSDSNHATMNVTITSGALVGARYPILTTGTEVITATDAFTIVPALVAPVLTRGRAR